MQARGDIWAPAPACGIVTVVKKGREFVEKNDCTERAPPTIDATDDFIHRPENQATVDRDRAIVRAKFALPADGHTQSKRPATITIHRMRLGDCTIVIAPVLRLRKNHRKNSRH